MITKKTIKQITLVSFTAFALCACSSVQKTESSATPSKENKASNNIISTIVNTANDVNIQKKDTRRQTDLKVLHTAIELYISDNDHAPTMAELTNATDAWDGGAGSLENILSEQIPSGLPKDTSSTPRDWIYCVNDTGSKYMVATTLEQNIEISGDLDGNTTGWMTNDPNPAKNDCISSSGGTFGTPQANAINCDDSNGGTIGNNSGAAAMCFGYHNN